MTTNLNKSSPANYEIIFPKIPTETTLESNAELTLNIYQTVIPSLTLGTREVDWMGAKGFRDSGDITFEPWFVHFIIDSQMANWLVLYKWLIYINNNNDVHGRSDDSYKVDATLKITDNFRNTILEVDFYNIWINMLGEITLSHREGNTQLTSTANFTYDRYVVRNLDNDLEE